MFLLPGPFYSASPTLKNLTFIIPLVFHLKYFVLSSVFKHPVTTVLPHFRIIMLAGLLYI